MEENSIEIQTNRKGDGFQLKQPLPTPNGQTPVIQTISPICLTVLYLIFLIVISVCLAIVSVGPNMYVSDTIYTWDCKNDTEIYDASCKGTNVLELQNNNKTFATARYFLGPFFKLNGNFEVKGKFVNLAKYQSV